MSSVLGPDLLRVNIYLDLSVLFEPIPLGEPHMKNSIANHLNQAKCKPNQGL